MRVYLDECVDWRLARDISAHHVKSARDIGWRAVRNGELLALAAAEFDVFITVDRNLAFQQNTRALSLAVVVLRAKSNRLADLKPLVPELVRILPALRPGTVTLIGDI